MFASLIPKPCTVHLTLGEEQVITHPRSAAVGGPDVPGQDPVIRGTVLLEVAVPRAVSRVKVVFEGLCDLFGESLVRGQRAWWVGAAGERVRGSVRAGQGKGRGLTCG